MSFLHISCFFTMPENSNKMNENHFSFNETTLPLLLLDVNRRFGR